LSAIFWRIGLERRRWIGAGNGTTSFQIRLRRTGD